MVSAVRSIVAAAVVTLVVAVTSAEARQAPVMNAPAVTGADIAFSWSATPGATSYRLDAGLAPGVYVASFNVGNVTAFNATAPAVAVYYTRIVALTPSGDVPSLEIAFTVSSLVAAPAPPTNLTIARAGVGIVATWAPGTGGGPASGYRLSVDLPQGGTAVLNLATPTFAYAPVPPGAYNFRVAALNAGGASADTANVPVTMPVGGACDAPPSPNVTQSVFGGFVSLTWAPVPGAAAYVLTGYQNGNQIGTLTVSGATSRFSITLGEGTWRIDVAAVFACGTQGAPTVSNIVIDQSTLKMQPRAADPSGPTPPNYIPMPNRSSLVQQLAAQYPGELRNSCGRGRHQFMFRLLNRLRQEDKRWGLNWKRNNVGDMSEDVLDYNYGSQPDEGTRQVHVVDFISGHCGPNPGPAWINQTVLFSSGATWTLVPYIEAGYVP